MYIIATQFRTLAEQTQFEYMIGMETWQDVARVLGNLREPGFLMPGSELNFKVTKIIGPPIPLDQVLDWTPHALAKRGFYDA